jgi:hypothetical protein
MIQVLSQQHVQNYSFLRDNEINILVRMIA